MCTRDFSPFRSTDRYCCLNCAKVAQTAQKRAKNKRKDKNSEYANNRSEKIQENIAIYGVITCENCRQFALKPPVFKEECHHIIFRSEKPRHKFMHDKRNLLILCVECHGLYHKNKSMRNELVEERGLYLLFGDDIRNK